MESVKGFKGFGPDMKCRDKQYAEYKQFAVDGEIEMCENGIHFCKEPLDIFPYYPPDGKNIFCEVEAADDTVIDKDNKSVTSKLRILGKVTLANMFKLHFSKIKEVCMASKYANTSGYRSHANTSGYEAHANTSGYEAHANTSGDRSHANTSGYEAIASAIGIESRASAKNGWIVITDWRHDDEEWHINNIHTAKVGGEINGITIEPDKQYWFEDGELKSEVCQ